MLRLTSGDPFNKRKVKEQPSGHLDCSPTDGNCRVPYGSPAFPIFEIPQVRHLSTFDFLLENLEALKKGGE
ncbi:hypothetical protein TNCT_66571 [Trichonephila clavata]|uniref:Uncharacterized protein n=1 Tax=Trichonephila clavata TaxID=2740835 RepID=A0A8X6G370_TRICU|nr:hypothetical protein TNCT_66571 [Trichonephila clavata]